MTVEKDVQVPMRDGTILYADVFRPDVGDERFPAIMNMSVYQKDKLWVPPADLEEVDPYMDWETVNRKPIRRPGLFRKKHLTTGLMSIMNSRKINNWARGKAETESGREHVPRGLLYGSERKTG